MHPDDHQATTHPSIFDETYYSAIYTFRGGQETPSCQLDSRSQIIGRICADFGAFGWIPPGVINGHLSIPSRQTFCPCFQQLHRNSRRRHRSRALAEHRDFTPFLTHYFARRSKAHSKPTTTHSHHPCRLIHRDHKVGGALDRLATGN